MRHRTARSRFTVIGAVGIVGALALIVAGGFWAHRMLGPRPDREDFDRVVFEGGKPFEKSAVGEFIVAVRRNDLRGLMALDDQPDSYANPHARRKGATWVLTHYADRLNGTVHVRFAPPSVSELELTGCLSFGSGERLVVRGFRKRNGPSYRIMLSSFPMEPVEAAAFCGSA